MVSSAEVQDYFVAIGTYFLGDTQNGGWKAPGLLHGQGVGQRHAGVLAQGL
jgi:hypothetical protein